MNIDSKPLSSEEPFAATAEREEPANSEPTLSTTRRGFLSLTLAGCAAGCAALSGCGAAGSDAGGSGKSRAAAGGGALGGDTPPDVTPMVQATQQGGDAWLVPGAGALKPGSGVLFLAAGAPVIVIGGKDGVRAFSGMCTHMGCAVEWKGAEKKFFCPCHASLFDANGKVLKGPAEKPLPTYSAKIQGSDAVVTVRA